VQARSIYLHFPFCETKCHYCDFYSLGVDRTRPGDAQTFEDALHREIALRAGDLAPELDTIFMGGGTPSMTPATTMTRALAPLWERTKLAPDYEWTMEANPSSVSLDSLREYRALGVNRISMGVQALRDDLLKDLGRVHSREAALRALDAIFEAGFTNVSVDLLCGVSGQSERDLEEAMQTLASYPITHLSCYLLTLAPHHPMFKRLPPEDEQLKHLALIDSVMTARGFVHYEISNFCKPGLPARHNLVYWKGGSYLGLGPSAHSYDAEDSKRWKNFSSLHRYGETLARGELPVEWEESLSLEQREIEKWMLALRLDEGFPEHWLTSERQKTKAHALVQAGMMEPHPERPGLLRLNARGFPLSDQIVKELIG
jgi:oxygen-independent coproporphyrinogen-3 oxidase